MNVSYNTAKNVQLSAANTQSQSTVTYSIISNPQHGTLSGTGPNVVYTPTNGYVGTDSISFQVNDSTAGTSLVSTVTFQVVPGIPAFTYGAVTGTVGTSLTVGPSSLTQNGAAVTCSLPNSADQTALSSVGLSLNSSCQILGTPTAVLNTSITVQATNSAGSATTAVTVHISAASLTALTVSSISPNQGVAGTSITLTGTGYYPSTTVTVGGQTCNVTSTELSTGSTSLTCTTNSSLTTGAQNVVVTNIGYSPVTSIGGFTVIAPPTIAYNNATGTTGSSLTISPTSSFSNNGSAITSCVVTSGTLPAGMNISSPSCQISGIPASLGSGPYVVTATNAAGSSNSNSFTITLNPGLPTVTSVLPTTGNPGTVITITGTGFITGTGGTTVTVGGSACTGLTVNSSGTQMSCSVPTLDPGTIDPILVTNSGQPPVNGGTFTYNSTPLVVTSMLPISGNSGTVITFTGSGFTSGTHGTTVTVGGNACSGITINSSGTQLACSAPTSTPGTVAIVLVTNLGLPSINPGNFTYYSLPVLTYGSLNGITNQALTNNIQSLQSNDGGGVTCALASTGNPSNLVANLAAIGLSFNTTTCLITGTPTAPWQASTIYVQASNSAGSITTNFTLAVVGVPSAASLSGLGWRLPCTNTPGTSCSCTSSNSQTTTVGGTAGGVYAATIRIRGIAEQKTYYGGTQVAGGWNIGGTPDGGSFNIYKLTVNNPTLGTQVYYVNPGTSGQSIIFVWDYTQTMQVESGATLTFLATDGGDNQEIANNTLSSVPDNNPAQPVIVTQPYNGQFMQFDTVGVTSLPLPAQHTIYYCSLSDLTWSNIQNWFTDAGCTNPALRLPGNGDTIVVQSVSNANFFAGGTPALSLNGYSGLAPADGTGLQTRNLNVSCSGTLNVTGGNWGGYGGTGHCPGPTTTTLYYCDQGDHKWGSSINWFSNSACTTAAQRVPTYLDNVVIQSAPTANFFIDAAPVITLTSYSGLAPADGNGSQTQNMSILSTGSLSLTGGNWGSDVAIAFTTPPTSSGAGNQQNITVKEYDFGTQVNTTDSFSSVSFTAYSSANCSGTPLSSGALSPATATLTNGIANITGFQINSVAVKSVMATIKSNTSCANSLVITPGTPANITVTSGNGQSMYNGVNMGQPLVVTVTDNYGNAVSGVSVTWVTNNMGTVSNCTPSTTDASGKMSCTYMATATGPNTVSATISGGNAPANFTETGNNDIYWNFVSSSNYSLSSTTLLDISGGVAELTPTNQSDNAANTSNSPTSGFDAGTSSTVGWDSTNNILRLSASVNSSDLDASWAPAWSNLIGLWHLNESSGATTAVDVSGNSYNGTAGSGVTFGSAGKVNTAASFNGSGTGYINVGNIGTFPTSGTLSFWMNPSVVTSYLNPISTGGLSSSNVGIRCEEASGGNFGCLIGNDGGAFSGQTLTTTLTAGQWYHVVLTWNTSLNTFGAYFNGNLIGQVSQTYWPTHLTNFVIGAGFSTGRTWQGQLDEVAIWNTALTWAQVQTIYSRQFAKYSGNFQSRIIDGVTSSTNWTNFNWTPSLPFYKALPDGGNSESSSAYPSETTSLMSGIVGLWHLDEAAGTTGSMSVIDNSGHSYNGTPTNVTFGLNGKFNTAANFNGNSYISMGNIAAMHVSSPITLSAWIYTSSTSSLQTILTDRASSNNAQFSFRINNGTNLEYYFNTGSTWIEFIANNVITSNTWTHVAATNDGTNIKLYVNGKVVYSTTTSATPAPSTGNIQIGGWVGATEPFNGLIDEVAYWSRALSGSELLELYRRGVNRLKFQVRSCTDSTCSSNPAWIGPDGSNLTYFSELNNTTSNTIGNSVLATSPNMTFANFSSSLTTNLGTGRYFQYRAILESDDVNTSCNYTGTATWCSPELTSASVGPNHYATTAPYVTSLVGNSFTTLSSFNEASSCAGGTLYNLSLDGNTWYYYNAASGSSNKWQVAGGTNATANSAATVNSNISSFVSNYGSGSLRMKVFLQSNGLTACSISSIYATP